MYRRDLRETRHDDLLADAATAEMAEQVVPEPDGDRLAYAVSREHRTDLYLRDGEETRKLTSRGLLAQRYTHLDPRWFDWHPEGESVAYAGEDDDGLSVWTVDVETGAKTRITAHGAIDSNPRFSPDGDEIAFVTDYRSPSALAVASADGRRVEVLRDDEYLYQDPRWAGDALYAVRTRHRDLSDRASQVVRVDRDGTVEPVFGGDSVNAYAPRPRPGSEGDELAFVHDASGYDALYLTGPDRAEPERLLAESGTDFGAPAWDADGDRLALTATRRGEVHVRTLAVESGETATLTDEPGDRYFPEWHDGDVLGVEATPTRPPEVRNLTTDERIAGRPPAGLEDRFVRPESITYDSTDGVEIHAMVYLPEGHDAADPDSIPLLVHPHGGPTAFDGYEFNHRAQYFAAQGFAVIEPNYRGSSGFGREFRNRNDFAWGEGDLDDVVNAADALADAYPAVDGNRAGIYGGSGGGLMTVNALGRTDRFDAGAAFYGVYDYETFADDTDDVGWRLMKRELGYPATDIDNYREASPVRSVPDIDAPLLVLHGEQDVRVPLSQSEQLVEELEKHGKTYELQTYDDEPHGFLKRENVLDAYSRVADLFAKYLEIDPDDGSSRPHSPDDGE
ncbi:S9 family peptidase [Halorussus gelatinilyticus]|uniref:S9 family peptidase n=1 Tax=Halorussus gelatinilyticus TaxID=2937524 RepID=A0A8U0IHJ9_9EURY|nr:S9 family peptidase [Halorussus gelatinilyticus]UPW00557.1 S9 family peptidase [Halorussus gelatinilyticus]